MPKGTEKHDENVSELERSQASLRSIVENAPNIIQITDSDLIVTYINRVATGLSKEDVVGHPSAHALPPKDRNRVQKLMRKVIATGKPAAYELTYKRKDGEVLWYRSTVGPIKNKNKVTGTVTIATDITADQTRIKQLEEGKRLAETARIRDRALLHSIGEGLIVIDESGLVSNINPSAAEMLGYKPRELIGKWFSGFVKVLDEDGKEIEPMDRPAMRALTTGTVISQIVRYKRKDGTDFPVTLTISPVLIKGKPVGVIEVFRDLTRERELEQAKEEFVSLASHQLRTPATGVKAFVSMLLDGYAGELNEQQKEFLNKVSMANDRQLQIVNEMLNVARVDAGKIVPDLTPIDLRLVVRDVIDEHRQTIRDRKQDLNVIMPEHPVYVMADPSLKRMALENILSNASKYTLENGTIYIHLRTKDGRAEVIVKDNGVGIAAEDIHKLFKRFSRINNPLSTKRGGTGLGLYLSQNIVLLHKGRLLVNSKVGEGTSFTIDLPLYKGSAVSDKKQAEGVTK